MSATVLLSVDAINPTPEAMARAAAVLRAGGLVAFPTETVYGLGANALDELAVRRIFAAKGRPANNPLIVHIAEISSIRSVVAEWPALAARLAERFWPGPLTLVLPRCEAIPDVVTAGGPTVAVRMPAHPVAAALIRAAGVPVAAPSANRSTRISPTRAEHVLHDLDGRIDLILDGGQTAGGIESTVIDLVSSPPRLLRPGLVTVHELEAVAGPINQMSLAAETDVPLRSPGMSPRHYAPRAPLELAEDDGGKLIAAYVKVGRRVGWLAFGSAGTECPLLVTRIAMPADPAGYAHRLYAALHELDDAGVERIVAALPPDLPEWLAVRDRLHRAGASA